MKLFWFSTHRHDFPHSCPFTIPSVMPLSLLYNLLILLGVLFCFVVVVVFITMLLFSLVCKTWEDRDHFTLYSFFFNFYLFMIVIRERERERGAETEGEAGSMHREPDVGFDPGSPGSRPGPLRHPGIPRAPASASFKQR